MFNNFFRINMPYGIVRNDKNEWMAFNREYLPLGFSKRILTDTEIDGADLMGLCYSKYNGLNEDFLIQLSHGNVERDIDSKIKRIWFYDDGSNPVNVSKKKQSEMFSNYFKKMELLSRLSILPTITYYHVQTKTP